MTRKTFSCIIHNCTAYVAVSSWPKVTETFFTWWICTAYKSFTGKKQPVTFTHKQSVRPPFQRYQIKKRLSVWLMGDHVYSACTERLHVPNEYNWSDLRFPWWIRVTQNKWWMQAEWKHWPSTISLEMQLKFIMCCLVPTCNEIGRQQFHLSPRPLQLGSSLWCLLGEVEERAQRLLRLEHLMMKMRWKLQ